MLDLYDTQVLNAPAGAQRRRPGRPGIQLEDVCAAADALLAQGLKPTIERVRRHLGGGSPNTVSALLDEWFARLPARLVGVAAPESRAQPDGLPLAVVQAAEQFWEVARREADQVQVQQSEASRRELELQREAMAQKEADLQQRETSFEQARLKLDDALAASKQALDALQAQMDRQQHESARQLAESEAEVRRLRKALEEAVAGKEALREKMAMELGARQRAAEEAEERHLAHERRMLSEIDRERMATNQGAAELAKVQKARAAEVEAARTALLSAQQAFNEKKAARRDADAIAARELQGVQIELATQRERVVAAEQRAADLGSQLQRQEQQAEREIAQLQESHAATAAALRQIESRVHETSKPRPPARKPRRKPAP
jgi:hypothetical protein